MLESIRPFLNEYITLGPSEIIINLILLIGIFIVSTIAYYVTKGLLYIVEHVVLHTATEWDDDIFNQRMLKAVSHLAPAVVVRWLIPTTFGDTDRMMYWLSAITSQYILWAFVRIITILIGNLHDAFLRRPQMRVYAVKGVFQMLKLIVVGVGVIVGISILIDKSPVVILTALGASAAILMLVFQDTILGLVASIQLTVNNMLQRGDWIEAKGQDVNGEVLEITLTAVKVKNWDNSVSTIPPYSLLKGSFRNYQPMRRSGGRRVERAVYIDANTVRFCTDPELRNLTEAGMLNGLDLTEAGKIVNLQLLRRYLEHYLAHHKNVNQDMLFMVRQMDPTPSGLPLELYFFVSTTEWKDFENISSDIFDHVYAVIHLFGLSMYQTPAGIDFASKPIK